MCSKAWVTTQDFSIEDFSIENQLSLLRRVKLKKALTATREASRFNLWNIRQSALTGILKNMKVCSELFFIIVRIN